MATNLARLTRGSETAVPLQEQFRHIDIKIKATGDGKLPGFILCGPPGWGKSYLVKNTLRAMGIEPMPISIQNDSALVHSLMKHRDERVLLLDDSDQLASRPSCVNLLKGAFGPDREVVWDSREVQKENHGHGLRFKVKSGLIWISNINYTDPTTRRAGDAHWDALFSRGIRPIWLDTSNEQDALSYIVHLATNGQMIFSESKPRFDKPTSETIVQLFIERRNYWKELSPRCMSQIIQSFSAGCAGSELRYTLLEELLAQRPVRQLTEIPCPKIVGKGVWE